MLRTSVSNLKLDNYQFNIIDQMSFRAKNLYNSSLYQLNKHFNDYKSGSKKEINSYLNYKSMDKLMKTIVDDKGLINYRMLPAQVSQQILMKLDMNCKSFFSLLKMKSNKLYDRNINMPRYLNKNGRFNLIFVRSKTSGSFDIKDNYLFITVPKDLHTKRLKIAKVPKYLNESDIKQIEIVPKYNRYELHITYDNNIKIEQNTDLNNWLSVDLGINNLCTITSNVQKSHIINGRPIKSMNKKFNKDLASAKSELKKSQNRYMSKRIDQLYSKRSNRLNNEIYKIVNFIVESIKRSSIDHIVIGYNKGWKDKSTMSRFTNQTFVQIPYTKIIDRITYMLNELGFEVFLQEESYTSKCSYINNESIEYHTTYQGKRLNRGLFVSSEGIRLNADINGSLNIYRKFLATLKESKNVVNDVYLRLSEPVDIGLVMNPIKINLRTNSSLNDVRTLLQSL